MNNQNMMNMSTPTNTMFYECKPVTSIDEAKAQSVRLDGMPVYLIDVGNKKIYEKKLNMTDGTAIFNVYSLLDNIDENQTSSVNNMDLSSIVKKEDLDEIKENVLLLTQKNDEILLNLQNLNLNGVDNNEHESNATHGNVTRGKSSSNSSKSSK